MKSSPLAAYSNSILSDSLFLKRRRNCVLTSFNSSISVLFAAKISVKTLSRNSIGQEEEEEEDNVLF